MTILEKQQKAPSFAAINEKGKTINSEDYLSKKNVVLFFYPKDDTSGCTIEALPIG